MLIDAPPARLAPRLVLAGARAAYVGPSMNLAPHRNAAATIAVGIAAPFELAIAGAPAQRREIALIPPGARHHLRGAGPMAFVYLDALSDDLRTLNQADLPALRRRLQTWLEAPDAGALAAALQTPRPGAPDPRMAAIIQAMTWRPDRYPSAAAAAAEAGLSTSRFQKRFRAGASMPFRRYRLWRRMALVVRAVSAGGTLTDAAMEAGFASSAHLSAAFRAMFGVAPSDLFARGLQVQVEPEASVG
ncbi:MAG: AraC family transcriptional regulator [Pseudomonadota bacterium]